MLLDITSADHKIVKQAASLKEKKYRDRYGAFLVEGAMSVLWALTSAYTVQTVVISQEYSVPTEIEAHFDGITVYRVPQRLFEKMADTKTPQGILCICALPERKCLPDSGLYVYCDKVRDPGNVGSIIRSADALGFDGVMLSPESVDVFSPKLVRSTMGSLFHINVFTDVTAENIAEMQQKGFALTVSALSDRAVTLGEETHTENTIITMGNEANGVSDAILALADNVVKIPMAGSAESLNVAAAAAILLFETAKARGRI